MLIKIQYNDAAERAAIIASNSGKYLFEEQNITEGNFLIFSDAMRVEDEVTQLKTELQATQEAVDYLIMGGI